LKQKTTTLDEIYKILTEEGLDVDQIVELISSITTEFVPKGKLGKLIQDYERLNESKAELLDLKADIDESGETKKGVA